ncbi:MAG: chromosome partition protein Smc [Cyclobacteriaceae bacterium]|nr:MAG: chromosome partition protein Smc [Cyclobacteriaceae bacterium]
MLLTKLEIKGFKSFADKVIINFDEGITGVVGPNGCGKSNVVDAIRWVLGEQKIKTLRSEKMENIIFNGTKKRKPTQLAEVSLSFDNTRNLLPTEYSQLTITRRYFRSGESEYQLNGVTCRLKDITNLFLDTGIGSDSYAIIELKMVDDLLNDKDNSRRNLFEEAAGVSKFKIRKKQTLKKLSDADADLERVDDLLFEIEKNLKSLEKQARQAEKYFKLKEDYKAQSITLAVRSAGKHREQFGQLTGKITAEGDRKLKLNTEQTELEASIQKSKSVLLDFEKLLADKQRKLNDHVSAIRKFESDKQIKNERLRYLNDKGDSLNQQIEQDKQSRERSEVSIKGLTQEKERTTTELVLSGQKVKSLQLAYEQHREKVVQLQQELQHITESHRVKKDRVHEIEKDYQIKEIQIHTLQQELDNASSDTTEKSASLDAFDQKIAEIAESIESKNTQLERLKQEENQLTERIESTEMTIEMIRDELVEQSRILDARQNEYNLTKSLVENLEGFPEAIKFLKQQAGWGKKAPLLSDIITCDEDYRITIENYLEPFMNYYIVDTESKAFQAINLLNEAAKGKAHFFILDSFKEYHPSTGKIFDNATSATEIVEYEHQYRNLVGHILDAVYIVDGDYANIPVDDSCTFITKNAKVTKKPHALSGGSVGLFEGKRIGRAKNLEKLQREIKALDKRIFKIKQSLESKQKELLQLKAETKRPRIEFLQNEIYRINEEYVSFRTKKDQFTQLIHSNRTKNEDITVKIAELTSEYEELKPLAESEAVQLAELELQIQQFNEKLVVENQHLSGKSATYNESNLYYHQQQNQLSKVESELAFKQAAQEQSEQRLRDNQNLLAGNQQEIEQLLESAEVNEGELLDMYQQKESLEKSVNEAEKEYYNCRGEIDSLETSNREIQRSREQSDMLLMELQNKLNETKIELNAVKERVSVEFNINIDSLDDPGDEHQQDGITEEELRNQVMKIREKLDRMGPVNPMAMEAYDEINQRHQFILTQKEDLLNAKTSLLTTIEEIDAVARETFLGAFNNIKANFIHVFRSLFTDEDDCDLRLADPDNPLESPIEIMAKPKGKRPLTINQLSGGEKTLTATSLLFAIYLLKPAPFCIFDEVDAPLDDANIDKFNKIIRKFSEESQFIIVTHNKRTMASTDVIYGITMIEQGVSRVVPVDLRELA